MKTVLKPFNLKSLHNRDKVVVVANDQILYSEVRVVCIDRLAFYSVIVLAKKVVTVLNISLHLVKKVKTPEIGN